MVTFSRVRGLLILKNARATQLKTHTGRAVDFADHKSLGESIERSRALQKQRVEESRAAMEEAQLKDCTAHARMHAWLRAKTMPD